MSDRILMPGNKIIRTLDGNYSINSNTQLEILHWIVDNIGGICEDDCLRINRSSHGYEVEVTR